MGQAGERMRVVVFSPGEANCLRVAGQRFFLARPRAGAPLMIDARCPHRGGPLHLGRIDDAAARIVCPMHGLGTALKTLNRTGLPMIVRRDQVLVVVPEDGVISPVKAQSMVSEPR